MEQQGEIILYQPDESVRMEVRIEDETVWLTQAQIASRTKRQLFKHLIYSKAAKASMFHKRASKESFIKKCRRTKF